MAMQGARFAVATGFRAGWTVASASRGSAAALGPRCTGVSAFSGRKFVPSWRPLCAAVSSNEGGAAAVPTEVVRPVRFIVPEKPRPQPVGTVMSLLRTELSERVTAKTARDPTWISFDQTVEVVVTVSTYDKNKKKGIPRDPFRGIIALPHTFGPQKQIAVLAEGDEADRATAAGASVVGGPDLLPQLAAGKIPFDVLLATPAMLPACKKFGRDLGPRMPSIKRGTAGEDTAMMIKQHMGGRPFRMDKHGRVRLGLGKMSFSDEQLEENLSMVLATIETHRLTPTGRFILGVHLSTTQARGCHPVHHESLMVTSRS